MKELSIIDIEGNVVVRTVLDIKGPDFILDFAIPKTVRLGRIEIKDIEEQEEENGVH